MTMNLLAQFLFTTTDGLFLVALFTCTPVVFTLMSLKSIRLVHVVINGVLFIVFAVPTAVAMSFAGSGSGIGGGIMLVAGLGSGGLALAFLVATLATSAVLALRGDVHSAKQRRKSRISPRGPSSPPLLDEFEQWKNDSRRPRATYQEFLEGAHFRYFPASLGHLIAAAIVMAVVFFLVLR